MFGGVVCDLVSLSGDKGVDAGGDGGAVEGWVGSTEGWWEAGEGIRGGEWRSLINVIYLVCNVDLAMIKNDGHNVPGQGLLMRSPDYGR